MLLSFKVRNYKSIRSEQTLSFEPMFEESEFDPLTVAAIYGTNASGKTNLLDAIRWALPQSSRPLREDGSLRTPFKLSHQEILKTSEASFEIRIDGVDYLYGFEVDDYSFIREWLYSYPKKRPRMLFDRQGDEIQVGSKVTDRREVHLFASKIQPHRSLLIALGDYRVPEWEPVFNWLTSIRYNFPSRLPFSIRSRHAAKMLNDFPAVVDIVRKADLGIQAIEVEERSLPPDSIDQEKTSQMEAEIQSLRAYLESDPPHSSAIRRQLDNLELQFNFLTSNRRNQELVFYHGDERRPLGIGEQSGGTLSFLNFIVRAVPVLKSGGMLLVDEIEADLHSRLVPRIIELFKNRESNPHGAQLIFTTHDTSLLGTSLGEPILRRDEIWFTEKNRSGATELFPLSDFKTRREGENRERRYLGGSYGAVPDVDTDSFVESVGRLVAEETERGTD